MLRRDAKTLCVKEQVINDLATGLTSILRVKPDGEARIELSGDALPFRNRTPQFEESGRLAATGTFRWRRL